MSGNVIEVRDLRKSFALSHSGVGSLKTALLWWRQRRVERLEALKGISLDIQKGECVALVGGNGAGKSTLLSILARVYLPTSGAFQTHGKLAPLLELGAGFHPDLTGVENVMFNAVVLGLTRKQAAAKLQGIIDFSGLHNHIDSPVRTYSSGMLARLGFAVAVHVEADVLIVDEVLAVGDHAFEEKCYAHIEQFISSGGTVLFVSHNMESIRRVATRCVWIDGGLVRLSGAPDKVIEDYLAAAAAPGSEQEGL